MSIYQRAAMLLFGIGLAAFGIFILASALAQIF